MMQAVDKREVAKRKPYRLSPEILAKRRRAKDIRNAKRVEMAERVSRANILMETIRDGTFPDKNRQTETAKAINLSDFGQNREHIV